MAVITPQTDVYLIKCPLELSDANQITFATVDAQVAYFQSLPKLHIADEDFTYQRKDGVMRVPALIDDLYGYNYCMYKNQGHGNKWFFAFITGMEYLNDSVTGVSLKTDTWQTWCFNLTFKRTFVEREHVLNDEYGLHTIPEGIEYGSEYQVNAIDNLLPDASAWPYGVDRTSTNKFTNQNFIVFQTTELPSGWSITTEYNSIFNGLFSGLYYFGVTSATDARKVIETGFSGNPDAIVSIFLAPRPFFDNSIRIPVMGADTDIYIPANTSNYTTMRDNVSTYGHPSSLDGYTPKNNKLLCWPYAFLRVDNNAGESAIFKFEEFNKETGTPAIPRRATFKMAGALGQGCAIKLIPMNYKNMPLLGWLYEDGVVGAKYPQCAWKSDYYTNWITQNGVNIASGAIGDTISTAFGAAAGMAMASTPLTTALAAGTAGVGALAHISKTVGQIGQATTRPDQARGAASSLDLNISTGNYFTVTSMTIKAEYAKVIDDYFSMFGYKVNEVKVPNIAGRKYWNFVKTINCYIEADIPQEDLEEIKSMFNKGITFWHDTSKFMDYSQNNDII